MNRFVQHRHKEQAGLADPHPEDFPSAIAACIGVAKGPSPAIMRTSWANRLVAQPGSSEMNYAGAGNFIKDDWGFD